MTRSYDTGPATDLFAALQRKSRVRRWLTAAVLGAVAGVFAGLVLDWPFELITAIGVAGALLAWDRRHGNLAGWWPAEHGPHRIAAVAARLETRGWACLFVSGASQPLRCLLVGRRGVFVAQHEAGPVSTDAHDGLVVGDLPAPGHVQALLVTADAVQAALADLSGSDVVVHAVLVVERSTLERPCVVGDATIVPVTDLPTWLCRRDIVLSQELTAVFALAAQRLFDDVPGRE